MAGTKILCWFYAFRFISSNHIIMYTYANFHQVLHLFSSQHHFFHSLGHLCLSQHVIEVMVGTGHLWLATAAETVVIELIQCWPGRYSRRCRRGGGIILAIHVPTVGIKLEVIEVNTDTINDTLEPRIISGTVLELLEKPGESVATTGNQRSIPSAEVIPIEAVVKWMIGNLCKSIGAVLIIGIVRTADSHSIVR